MDAVEYYQNYIAHFGTKGQTWGLRRYQSYETAPTRSGMVGQEVGDAAEQSERLTRKEKSLEKYREKLSREANLMDSSRYSGAKRRYDKSLSKYTKTLEKWTDIARPRTEAMDSIDKTDADALKAFEKKDRPVRRKMGALQRKMDLQLAKTEEARKAVNMAYIDGMLQQTAIRRMTYKELKSDRNKRRINAALAIAFVPPALAGYAMVTGVQKQREERLAKYKKEHSYTDPKTGLTEYSLTDAGDRTLGGARDGYADFVKKEKRRS